MFRARHAAAAAAEIAELGRDAIGSARQWNFKRQTDVHPIDQIDDPRLAAGALAVCLTELGPSPTDAQARALLVAAQSHLNMSREEADELLVLTRWFIQSSTNVEGALSRTARRLRRLGEDVWLDRALYVVRDQVSAGEGALSDQQRIALSDVAQAFGRRT